MADLGDLAKRMHARANRAQAAANRVVSKMVTTIVEEVAPNTPIDTGQAQSNWMTFIGTATPYYKANMQFNSAAAESIAMAHRVMKSWNGYGDIHIVNNVPYISKLNAGSSQQAPRLFVQAAILRARYTIRNYRLRI